LEKKLVYLSRPGELYVTRMTEKKPEPELLSTFDDSIHLDEMVLDTAGNRIFAMDQGTGSLYLFDLSLDSPTPDLMVSDLGAITEMELALEESSLLLLDTVGKRIHRVDCPRDSAGCSAPELFAAIPEFERPVAMARTTDGTVWVGDLGAQSLFAFDADGQVVEVLDSMFGLR